MALDGQSSHATFRVWWGCPRCTPCRGGAQGGGAPHPAHGVQGGV